VLLAHGVPGGGIAVESVLNEFLHVQDEQVESLRRIEKNVQRLINRDWKSARALIEEAKLPNRTPAGRREDLFKAADKMRDAIQVQDERTYARAYACIDLSLIFWALGEDERGRHYAAQAKHDADCFLKDASGHRVRPPEYWTSWRAAIAVGAAGVGLGALTAFVAPQGSPAAVAMGVKSAQSMLGGTWQGWLKEVHSEHEAITSVCAVLSKAGPVLPPA